MLSWSVWRRHENSWTPPQSSSFLLDVRLAVSHQVHFSVSSIRVCLSVTGFTVLSPASGSVCHRFHCSVTSIRVCLSPVSLFCYQNPKQTNNNNNNKNNRRSKNKSLRLQPVVFFFLSPSFSLFCYQHSGLSVTNFTILLPASSPASLFSHQHPGLSVCHQSHCSVISIRVRLSPVLLFCYRKNARQEAYLHIPTCLSGRM